MLTLILQSVIAAAGLFLMILSLRWVPGPRQLRRIQDLRLGGHPAEDQGTDVVQTFRTRGLEAALLQADLPVHPARFLQSALLLGLAGLAVGWLLGGVLVAGFCAAASLVGYLYWLSWRRDSRRLAYEEALADLCDRLAAGALLTSTLQGALAHAAESAPEILRTDVAYIASQLSQTGRVQTAFAEVLERRRSSALQLLADTLDVWSRRGATLPLQDILAPLATSIRDMAAAGKRMNSELSGTRMTLLIVSLAPTGFVLLLRLTTPALDQIYASPAGQWIQIAAYTIAGTGFLLGQRMLQRVQAVLTLEEKAP